MNRNFKAVLLAVSFSLLALFSGLRGYRSVFAGTLLVLVAIGLAYLSNRFVFSKLTVESALNRRQVEFDGKITLQLSVTNRKILPVFGLKIENTVSPGLELDSAANLIEIKGGAHNLFRDHFSLNSYERRKRVYELRPLRRGRFEFGSGTVSYADPFGFFTNRKEQVVTGTKLVVFPRVVPIKGIAALNTYLFGSRSREGWIFTDPLNRIGTRPYESTDSARLINWKATARQARIQVNVEKPSFDQQIYLFLEQPPHLKWWAASVSNTLEVGVMAAASLIDNYTRQGYQINFATNLVSCLYGVNSAPGRAARGKTQRSKLLADLSLLQNFSVEPAENLLRKWQKWIERGSTVVIISTAPDELEQNFVQAIRRLMARARVAVVRVQSDSHNLPAAAGLKEWKIEGGNPWHELAALELF